MIHSEKLIILSSFCPTICRNTASGLKGGTNTDQFTYDDIIKLAESTVGNDKFGYRHEFLGLVRLAKAIE